MFCPNCNQSVDAASSYCSHCGCALPKEEPPMQSGTNGLPSTNIMDINAELRKAKQKEHGFADMFYKAEGRLNRKPYILRVLVLQVAGFCLQLMGLISGAAAAGGFGWQVFCFLIVGIPSSILRWWFMRFASKERQDQIVLDLIHWLETDAFKCLQSYFAVDVMGMV